MVVLSHLSCNEFKYKLSVESQRHGISMEQCEKKYYGKIVLQQLIAINSSWDYNGSYIRACISNAVIDVNDIIIGKVKGLSFAEICILFEDLAYSIPNTLKLKFWYEPVNQQKTNIYQAFVGYESVVSNKLEYIKILVLPRNSTGGAEENMLPPDLMTKLQKQKPESLEFYVKLDESIKQLVLKKEPVTEAKLVNILNKTMSKPIPKEILTQHLKTPVAQKILNEHIQNKSITTKSNAQSIKDDNIYNKTKNNEATVSKKLISTYKSVPTTEHTKNQKKDESKTQNPPQHPKANTNPTTKIRTQINKERV